MLVSWDDEIPNWMEKIKKCSEPPTSVFKKKNEQLKNEPPDIGALWMASQSPLQFGEIMGVKHRWRDHLNCFPSIIAMENP